MPRLIINSKNPLKLHFELTILTQVAAIFIFENQLYITNNQIKSVDMSNEVAITDKY